MINTAQQHGIKKQILHLNLMKLVNYLKIYSQIWKLLEIGIRHNNWNILMYILEVLDQSIKWIKRVEYFFLEKMKN